MNREAAAKILVVDDHPGNLSLATSILKPFYEIFLANNSEKALLMASEKQPDLILLDIMMPDISGFEVCRRLKQLENTAGIPIIFMTAKTSGEDYEKAFDMGGVDYITKPINSKELLSRVKTHLLINSQRTYLENLNQQIFEMNSNLETEVQKGTRKLLIANKQLSSLVEIKEEQNKRLQNFTHIVSHNLRSHTANLQGLLAIMEMENPELFENQYLQLVEQATNNLNKTILHLNEVLTSFNTEREQWGSLNLNKAVNSTISSIAQLAKDAKVSFFNEVPDEFNIFCISNYLESIILNILTNAIKYRSEERNCFLRVSADQEDDYFVIVFEDNGLGIDMKRYRDKLFGMYQTFHTHKVSNGLGLFITKNQIEVMGGKIEVESQVNVGTIFKVYLPYEKS